MESALTKIVIGVILVSFVGGLVATLVPMWKSNTATTTMAENNWYLGLSINVGVVLLLALLTSAAVRNAVVKQPVIGMALVSGFCMFFAEYADTTHVISVHLWQVIRLMSLLGIFYIYQDLNGFPNPLVEWRPKFTKLE